MPRFAHRYFVITLHAHARTKKLPPLKAKRAAIREARKQVAEGGIGAHADVHLITASAAPMLIYQARGDRVDGKVHVTALEL